MEVKGLFSLQVYCDGMFMPLLFVFLLQRVFLCFVSSTSIMKPRRDPWGGQSKSDNRLLECVGFFDF